MVKLVDTLVLEASTARCVGSSPTVPTTETHQGTPMSDTTIYHNPRCSKSRDTLALLLGAGVEPTVVEYLKHPLSPGRLQELATFLGVRPRALVRTKEVQLASLRLDLDDDAAVLAALSSHPVLLERPIVVRDGRAVVGRPPESVRALL